ncbi:hypothetical protein F5876DRAFT_71809 [Lentinula aff. lateritia]|uniref:Uncharacterized protein n=1 Tax=Lentinula aff. lateritia TaxID=2804960 RepID=A0ACC1UEV8_9AGAR|nr:hypothetical protein F5876DRAFT_71809 [Lentinula aff. lateritia]
MSQTKYTTLINNCKLFFHSFNVTQHLAAIDFQTPGRRPDSLSFEESSVVGADKAVWTVICKVNGETKGKGESSTKAEAKNQASKNALEALGQSTA